MDSFISNRTGGNVRRKENLAFTICRVFVGIVLVLLFAAAVVCYVGAESTNQSFSDFLRDVLIFLFKGAIWKTLSGGWFLGNCASCYLALSFRFRRRQGRPGAELSALSFAAKGPVAYRNSGLFIWLTPHQTRCYTLRVDKQIEKH